MARKGLLAGAKYNNILAHVTRFVLREEPSAGHSGVFSMKRRYLIITVVIAAIAAAVFFRQTYRQGPAQAEGPHGRVRVPVAVEVAPVARQAINEIGIYTGTLLPESQFTVAPKVAGRLEKILVDIGDEVRRGELIALLDDDEFVQQVDQARAELDVALANIEESSSELGLRRREFERAKTLREKKIISESELDAAEAQYTAALAKQKVAQAQAVQKEAVLKAAQVRLDYTRIRASWEDSSRSRVVGERYVDEGAMLAANDSIVSVVGIDTLKAVIHVIERDYPRIRAGQEAIITTDAHPGQTFSGTIARVAPVLKEAARQARVEITVDNPGKALTPGMFVRVQIRFDRRENARVVPVKALVRNNGTRSVFLADMEHSRARLVPVEIGIIEEDMAEVVSPEIAGFVVTVGHHLLEDGSQIILPEAMPQRKTGDDPEGRAPEDESSRP
ncbi:MAG: Macrolide export protein MacA [Deltaproteobacteria bacterium ADurb.BinA179]|nr:MAG: Macrolide export protein MacA [Deltaproteobacteria bacterium ADurb.BinA179]